MGQCEIVKTELTTHILNVDMSRFELLHENSFEVRLGDSRVLRVRHDGIEVIESRY